MVVASDIQCYSRELVFTKQYVNTWQDTVYNNMFNYLYGTVKTDSLLYTTSENAITKTELGRDAYCDYEKIEYWFSLIDYLILFIDECINTTTCTVANYQSILDKYDFSCIRNNSLCGYNSTVVFDNLIKIAGISKLDATYLFNQYCTTCEDALLLEDGTAILLEDGTCLLLE